MSERDLTVGPVGKLLLRPTAPMVLGVFAVISAGLVAVNTAARYGLWRYGR